MFKAFTLRIMVLWMIMQE